MKRLCSVLLLALSSSVFAQDQLPQVDSLLPRAGFDRHGQDMYESQYADPQGQEIASTQSHEAMLLQWFERVEALQMQVQELTGKIEEQEFRLTQIQERHHKELESLKNVMGKVDNVVKSQPVFTDLPMERPEQTSSIEFETPARVEGEIYQAGYRHLQAKRYTQAKYDFQEIVENHPNGQFAPNAYYWLGEIYLLQDELDNAQKSFEAVTLNYSSHPKSADALLKLGFVAMQQNNPVKAKGYLVEVKQKFPNTVAARLAENRLHQIEANDNQLVD